MEPIRHTPVETRRRAAIEIHTLMAELNKIVREANKLGLTVEIRPSYGRVEKYEEPFNCRVGEYVAYSKE